MQSTSLESIANQLAPTKFGLRGKIWVIFLLIICFVGIYSYYKQIKLGLSVTGMRDYASWGIYISNFVFFVAISLVGSLITAILRLTKTNWSTPLTRISEIIAVASILFASFIIVIDMGRPDRILNLFIYGRIQSPIIWDVLVITTYLFLSILLLYIPLIPDLKLLSTNKNVSPGIRKVYRILSLNWKGTKGQIQRSEKSIRIISVLIIPVALAIHTVTAWLFATTYRPGWDSTNFGPYFVSGAFLVGAGGVIIAMYVFRRYYGYQNFITEKHFDNMGKLLIMLSLLYLYFNINEYLVPAYKMKVAEEAHILEMFSGSFSTMFWSVILLGMIVPIIVLLFKKGRKPLPMFIIGIFVVIGAWFKRYLIVTPTLLHPFLPKYDAPESYFTYVPTFEEWSITLGSLAGALLIITLFARYFPIIPIDETCKESLNCDEKNEN